MQQHIKSALLSGLAVMLFSLTGEAAVAGKISFIQGTAFSVSSSGATTGLSRGTELQSGDTIRTEPDAFIQIRLNDGSKIALQPGTEFRIDDYSYNGNEDGTERVFMSLLKGALRTVTGAIGHTNKKNYRMSTATATIGIRGTEFALRYDGSTLVTVGEGAISMCNTSSNCLDLKGGQSGVIFDKNSAPVFTSQTVTQDTRKSGTATAELLPPRSLTEFRPNDTPNVDSLIGGDSTSGFVNVPLASGVGGLAVFAQGPGGFTSGLLGGNLTFDSNGVLTSFRDGTFTSDGYDITTNGESYSDGIITWGRWVSGLPAGNVASSTGSPLGVFAYVGSLSSSATSSAVLATLTGTYTAFGSSAPTINSSGTVIATGSPNSVTGNLNANFSAGTVGYNLAIPVAGQIFNMSGTATFTAQSPGDSRFLGGGSISSTGSGCSSTCSGIIPFGPDISGYITGANGERAGTIYGFNSDLGKVTGAVVFSKN